MSSDRSPRKTLRTAPVEPNRKTASTGAGVVSRAEIDLLRQKITDLISEKPEKAAVILADWLKQAAKSSRRKAG